jgi:hypothetical protein
LKFSSFNFLYKKLSGYQKENRKKSEKKTNEKSNGIKKTQKRKKTSCPAMGLAQPIPPCAER